MKPVETNSERLFELLTELSSDPFQQEDFARDPEAVLDAAGLTPEERLALGRWRKGGVPGLPGLRSAALFDPGPDPSPDPDPPESHHAML